MNHLAILDASDRTPLNGKGVHQRAAGRFYTHEAIGTRLAHECVSRLTPSARVSIIDPFAGDGRLLAWALPAVHARGATSVIAHCWDVSPAGLLEARDRIEAVARTLGLSVEVVPWEGDTFERAATTDELFHLVLTNPPWELLKPDHRELRCLPDLAREEYVSALKAFDATLAERFPTSQPSRRFAGWGTNLSRVGTEIALRLTRPAGVCGVVCPTSLLADSTTGRLREWLLERFALVDVTHWPAEARLFDKVDVPCVSAVAVAGSDCRTTRITRMTPALGTQDSGTVVLDRAWLRDRGFSIPAAHGAKSVALLRELDSHPLLASLEGSGQRDLWAGRELDETRRQEFTRPFGRHAFVRARHVTRLRQCTLPEAEFVDTTVRKVPRSSERVRLVWRDISRPSQQRRVQAGLIPSGAVTGNSASVAYFRDGDLARLVALLGVVSSTVFEYQVRSLLMTNHVSLSVMRAARIPSLDPTSVPALAEATHECLKGAPGAEARLERAVARAYGLDFETWSSISGAFELGDSLRRAVRDEWDSPDAT